MAKHDSDFKFYRYDPSFAAALLFAILFLLTSLLHIFQLVRTRTWYFTPLVVGGLVECIGYIGRILSTRQTPNWTLGPYVIQATFLLVAPALFAATIYMILGRIIVALDGEKYSLIKKRWLTKIFVTCDIVSFLVLSSGAGILADGNTTLGQDIILAGLFIQIIAFGIFIFVALLFHKRIHSRPTHKSMQPNMPWPKHLYVLYFVSGLIMIRSVVRVVEYIQGNDGYILSHEIFLYIFDGTLMFVTITIFNVVHPNELLPGKKLHDRQVSLEPVVRTGLEYDG